jgi:hypothetical protein
MPLFVQLARRPHFFSFSLIIRANQSSERENQNKNGGRRSQDRRKNLMPSNVCNQGQREHGKEADLKVRKPWLLDPFEPEEHSRNQRTDSGNKKEEHEIRSPKEMKQAREVNNQQ